MNKTYFPSVRKQLKLSSIPKDVYNSIPYGHSRVWDKQAQNAGYSVNQPDSIFNWDILRAELQLKSLPSATIGMSNMGNSNGAKFDLTQNYLRDGQLTGNVGVFSNQRVTDIAKTFSGYAVIVEKLSPAGAVIDKYKLECEYLVLSAGSIGSVELLMKAREKGLIPGLHSNNEIGQGWGSNGDSIVTRSFNPIRDIVQAAPCSSLVHDNDGPLPVSVEAWYVPGVPIDVGIQGTLGMAFDMENHGRFVYDPSRDAVDLDWPDNWNDLAVEATRIVNNRLANASPKKHSWGTVVCTRRVGGLHGTSTGRGGVGKSI